MDDNEPREKARQSEATARESISRMTDETLSVTWLATEVVPMSVELAMTRGWLMDELEKRMGAVKFDAWVFASSDVVNPLPYLAG